MQLWFLLNKRQGISMISDVDSYRAILKYILKAYVLTDTTLSNNKVTLVVAP